MEAAVNGKTKLVSVSLVSTTNGFQHDLKRVADIAHAHGAYVYADIIHGAGTVPIDLRARFRRVFNDMNDIDRLLGALPKAPPA
jgi:selenocysteine lyase/cysteine desulfurase